MQLHDMRSSRPPFPSGPTPSPDSEPDSDVEREPNTFPFEVFRRTRFVRGVRCPRCGGSEVRRWGGFAGRQRFRCSSCARTFSDFTGTPLAYLKKIDRWPGHCASIEETESVRREAARL